MRFIDEAKVYLRSGNGGNGCVSFRREKFIRYGGPNGGNGGNGGSIIISANKNHNTLINFRYKQHFKASHGENGKGSDCSGKAGSHLILTVPVGTQIFDDTGSVLIYDCKHEEEFELIKGGKGGLGNTNFKSSRNQAPRFATSGEEGVEMWVWLKLKILSDVGIIGMPNAGKSTFLRTITNAKPKVASYPFTTINPVLGVITVQDNEITIADIPGLIEGAHEGKGLGYRFLKHSERCRFFLHFLDSNSDNIFQDYNIIRKELTLFSKDLINKEVIVCLTKVDMLEEEELKEKVMSLQNLINKPVFTISSYAEQGIKSLVNTIIGKYNEYQT